MTPITSPLAVKGTASAVASPGPLAIRRRRRDRGQLGTAGPVGEGGGRVGVEGNAVRADQALGRRRGEDLVPSHVESLQPALAGNLHDAGVGQPAHHQVHRALHHRGRVQAGAQQLGHVGEQGQALAARLGLAQGLAFLLEELRPLERLRRQAGQRREEAQFGLARLGPRHEGEGEDAERAGTAHEGLGHDGDRLAQLRHGAGHDLGREVGVARRSAAAERGHDRAGPR